MQAMVRRGGWVLVAMACGYVSACSAASESSGTAGTSNVGGAGGAGSAGHGGAGMTSGGGDGNITVGSGGGGGGGGEASYITYAHTNKTLFQLDPAAAKLNLVSIGDFDCIGGTGQDTSMNDIAVNDQGEIWGISISFIYRLEVQGATIHCASQIPLNSPQKVKFYALTFAPVGVIDPNKEVLIAGNTAGELWAVDDTGNMTLHGNFGLVPKDDGNGHTYPVNNQGKAWELSGDIAFVANGGKPVGFATVRDCPTPPSASNCSTTDTLIEINVPQLKTATTGSITASVRGQIVKRASCADTGNPAGYGGMYGIALLNDKVYGFSHGGSIVEIDNTDGSACLIQNIPGDFWDGAGVTTLAPVLPPPPK